ncbi:unnamed protein product [Pieris macdunnoughi]|uniref:RNA-directed DNA polymerase n=1 Tax=Pieris macdunnoughi TaxID=345717 RepID=A0A821Y368_9NEOP|nr:unnamed protein product [Pieris macdunnoughi]
MESGRYNSGGTPTAAVGSQPQVTSESSNDTTFTMEQVMGLLTSITKTAATSAVKATLSTDGATLRRHHDFYLPPFNPDERSHDIRDWCANVDETITKLMVPPHEARMKAILQLRGRAKTWADSWSLHSTTWEQVKEELIHTFSNEFRYADDVQKWRNYTSDQASCYAEYATTAWALFKRIRPEATDAEVVDALITGICSEFIRSELLRNTPNSLPKLVSVLKTFRKRKIENRESKYDVKKSRVTLSSKDQVVCFTCKKTGHLSRDCPERNPSKTNVISSRFSNNDSSFRGTLNNTKVIECDYCHRKGHLEKNCYRRQNGERNAPIKSINCCSSIKRSTTKVIIGTKQYNCLFDTGADCSLIRKSIAGSIPGKRKQVDVQFMGIGGQKVISKQSITTMVEIDNVTLELAFYVVGDSETQFDILIGYNLLKIPGLTVTLSENDISINRKFIVNECSNLTPPIEIDTDLTNQSQINEIFYIINEFKDNFTSGNHVSRVTTGELKIRLKNPDKIVQRRPYRLSPVEREKVREMIQDLKENGIIRDSSSPFSSPILLVKKKNGTDRLCVDFRELNSNTVRDNYPLPLIADQIDRLGKARYYSCLDMASGFHGIPISEDSIEKTAFVTPDGQFEYLRMPFGLCNAPSVYQRSINVALGDYKDNIALVYIDDILVVSESVQQGLINLKLVLTRLTRAGFSLNISKCSFLKTKIEYLGNIVENGTVRPSPRKIQALTESSVPKNVKEVRQFNGLAGYFRKFVPNFSKIMVPLYNLTKSNINFNWTEDHEIARRKIINILTSSPVLTIFDPNLPTELHTDASSIGYGAVLIQRQDRNPLVIAYFSMRTSSTESKYHSYELETLAVVKAIKHFRHFLHGRSFKVVTDCNSLKASSHKRDLTPRVHRWWAFLQNFQFEIEYRKGNKLAHADFFSRNPVKHYNGCHLNQCSKINKPSSLVWSVNAATLDHNWLLIEQKRDSTLADIVEQLKGDSIPKTIADTYVILQDKLLRRKIQINNKTHKLIIVPRNYRWNLISHYHDNLQHFGWDKVLAKLREQYWFPNMTKLVRKFVENCVMCRVRKGVSGARQVALHPIDKIAIPFHTVHADITGRMNGKRNEPEYAFVFIDGFTKYVHMTYTNDRTSDTAIKCFLNLITIFGTPSRLITDQDKSMTSTDFKNFCEQYGIQHHVVAKGASRANGQVERLMKVIKDNMSIIEISRPWHTALQELQLAINCTVSKSTGKSPMELLLGKKCSPPAIKILQIDDDEQTDDLNEVRFLAKKRMDERSLSDKSRFDKGKATIHPFKVGDFVLMRRHERHTTKLGCKFEGPMEILQVLPNDRYRLKHINLRGCSEKIASHDALRPAPIAQSDPLDYSSNSDELTAWAEDSSETDLREEASTSS